MKERMKTADLERRLRRDAPGEPTVGRRFRASLESRLDETDAVGAGPSLPGSGRRLLVGGLALAAVVGLAAVVWLPRGPAAAPERSEATKAMAEALEISTREQPRRVAAALSRGGSPLAAEQERLVHDARELGRSLLAPLRSVAGG